MLHLVPVKVFEQTSQIFVQKMARNEELQQDPQLITWENNKINIQYIFDRGPLLDREKQFGIPVHGIHNASNAALDHLLL